MKEVTKRIYLNPSIKKIAAKYHEKIIIPIFYRFHPYFQIKLINKKYAYFDLIWIVKLVSDYAMKIKNCELKFDQSEQIELKLNLSDWSNPNLQFAIKPPMRRLIRALINFIDGW